MAISNWFVPFYYLFMSIVFFINSKTEEIRNVIMEITKLIQKKKNLEEDLDHILSDADLEEYKKLGL